MLREPCSTVARPKILVHPPEDLPRHVVVAYLNNCRQSLESLKDAIERVDYDFLGIYGHRMKGCGAAYGFPELTETGASIEQAARVRDDDNLWNCAARLEAHLDSVEVAEP